MVLASVSSVVLCCCAGRIALQQGWMSRCNMNAATNVSRDTALLHRNRQVQWYENHRTVRSRAS